MSTTSRYALPRVTNFWQVIQLRGRMGGILNLLNGMFGGGGNIVEKADVAVEKLQGYKERMVS